MAEKGVGVSKEVLCGEKGVSVEGGSMWQKGCRKVTLRIPSLSGVLGAARSLSGENVRQ